MCSSIRICMHRLTTVVGVDIDVLPTLFPCAQLSFESKDILLIYNPIGQQ